MVFNIEIIKEIEEKVLYDEDLTKEEREIYEFLKDFCGWGDSIYKVAKQAFEIVEGLNYYR